MLLAWVAATSDSRTSCVDLTSKCTKSLNCLNAKHNVDIACSAEITLDEYNCSINCQKAFVTLSILSIGLDSLEKCLCDPRNGLCLRTQLAHSRCKEQRVLPNRRIKCTEAERVCKKDPVCKHALRYFASWCKDALVGKTCSDNCQRSITALGWSQNGTDVLSCKCGDNKNCKSRRSFLHVLCGLPEPVDDNDAVLRQTSVTVILASLTVFYLSKLCVSF